MAENPNDESGVSGNWISLDKQAYFYRRGGLILCEVLALNRREIRFKAKNPVYPGDEIRMALGDLVITATVVDNGGQEVLGRYYPLDDASYEYVSSLSSQPGKRDTGRWL